MGTSCAGVIQLHLEKKKGISAFHFLHHGAGNGSIKPTPASAEALSRLFSSFFWKQGFGKVRESSRTFERTIQRV